jgi:hypothetical protein
MYVHRYTQASHLPYFFSSSAAAGRPDEFAKETTEMQPKLFFCQNEYKTFFWGKTVAYVKRWNTYMHT